jgi:hypothetical protein
MDGRPLVPAREGIHSVELANAILYSSLTAKPVSLPLDGQAYERRLKGLIRESTFRKSPGKKGVKVELEQSFQ